MDLNKKFEKAYKKMDRLHEVKIGRVVAIKMDKEVIVNIPTDNGKDCYYLVKILKKI